MQSWSVTSPDGTPIVAYELGGAGEVVLIAHATGLCGPMYRRLAERLTHRFRVVTFDFRGHGRSGSPSDPHGLEWSHLADDLAAVRTALGAETVHGFGHSLGGTTLLMAERDVPGRFASLCLYEPIVYSPGEPVDQQFALGAGARRRRPEFGSRDEALARYAAKPPFDTVLAGALLDYVTHGFADTPSGGVRLCCAPDTEATVFDEAVKTRIDEIAVAEVPTLVQRGGDDGPGHLSVAVSARLPNATLRQYPHLDHFGPFQDPISLAADLVDHACAVS